MTKKQLLHIIAFCLLVCVIFVFLCELFESDNSEDFCKNFYTYTTYPEGTVDAIFIGTSGTDRYWIASKAYKDYGMTVYPLACDAMPAWLYTNVIEFALNYQDPELVLVDMRAYAESFGSKSMDIRSRRVLDSLPMFSRDWFSVAFKSMRLIHSIDNTKPRFDVSFVLPFVRYHQKWEEADLSFFSNNLGHHLNEYNGFPTNTWYNTLIVEQTPVIRNDECAELEPLALSSLYELLDFAEERGLQLLFVDTPQFQDAIEIQRTNTLYKILDAEGLDYINWYSTEHDGSFTIELDPAKHFYNESHVNFEGAQIFTNGLAAYLNEYYPLPDRREDETAKEIWDGVYDELVSCMSK